MKVTLFWKFSRRSAAILSSLALLSACGGGGGGEEGGASSGGGENGDSISYPLQVGKYTIIDLRTDETNKATAKQNAENALLKYPDVDAMVGLWAYNAPQCLEAIREADMLGKVKVFSFDEDEATLLAIEKGEMEGTIVQQPYEFGYQSMKYLKMIYDGKQDEIGVPESKLLDIPAKTITKGNVTDFAAKLKTLRELGAQAEAASEKEDKDPEGVPKFAFVINTADPFWSYARAGCFKAEQDFNIICDFETPHDGSSTEQNRIMENILLRGGYSGVAVTPLEPDNQTDQINKVAAEMPLLCHDSDAPNSDRLFYLGTNNVDAGRMLGELIKGRMPDGGKIMVFVGKIDVLNARQRRDGMIAALRGE
jgi:ribose transport system substrate-binding protein